MKPLLSVLLLLSSTPAFAAAGVAEGNSCRLEGERAYVENADDSRNDDVYVCESGAWKFLYTRAWNDGQD